MAGSRRRIMTEAEKRVHRRFDLALPVRVRVQTQAPMMLETATKDISARGVYFEIQGDFGLGSVVECELTLPPELCQGSSNMRVRCKGRIVRVERREEDFVGVAATIDDD